MTNPKIDVRRPHLALMLRLLLGLACLLSACSRPESLFIGSYELTYEEVVDAEASLARSFPATGSGTLRSHLMQFGLGTAAILHQAHPEKSAAARAVADAWVRRLQDGEPFLDLMQEQAQALGTQVELGAPHLPSPSGLGASVAAAIASIEDGAWIGPVKTSLGWEVVLLERRMPGARNRAQVYLYRLQAPVGDATSRNQAQEDWATLPLRGNPELIRDLPLSFRRDRTQPAPE